MRNGKQWLMAGVVALSGSMVYADDVAAAPAEAPAAAPVAAAGELSFNGYIDMSYSTIDPEEGQSTDTFGLDRYELQSVYDTKMGLVGRAHIFGSANEDESEDVDLEQANVTYTKDAVSLVAGKYWSKLGYEASDAPNLYQWSVSETLVYPGAMNGAGLTYAAGMVSIYGAALANVWDGSDKDADALGYEAQLKLTPVTGLTLQAGYATDSTDSWTDEMGMWYEEYDQTLVNLWAEYKAGVLTLAAEWNDVSDWGAADVDGDGYLVMANVAMCSKSALTLRHSALDVEGVKDSSEFTVAPSYKVTGNWLAVAEYKTVEDDINGDWDSYALESIFTF